MATIRKKLAGYFGRDVIGDEQRTAEKQLRARKGHIYGSEVLMPSPSRKVVASPPGGRARQADEVRQPDEDDLGVEYDLTASAGANEDEVNRVRQMIEKLQERLRIMTEGPPDIAQADAKSAQDSTNPEPRAPFLALADEREREKAAVGSRQSREYEAASSELTEDDIRDALDKQPNLYQRFLDLELTRSRGPRKGVTRLLLERENARKDGPRPEIVKRLEAIID